MAKCPHCQQPVTLEKAKRETGNLPEEVHKEVVGFIKKEIMYSCPHCDAVLGFSFFPGGLATGRGREEALKVASGAYSSQYWESW